jgi:hypothetical protein
MFTLQINTDLLEPILTSGPNSVTGWGIALGLSLAFNYLIYKEFKFLQDKFLSHLEKLSTTLDDLHNKFNQSK